MNGNIFFIIRQRKGNIEEPTFHCYLLELRNILFKTIEILYEQHGLNDFVIVIHNYSVLNPCRVVSVLIGVSPK